MKKYVGYCCIIWLLLISFNGNSQCSEVLKKNDFYQILKPFSYDGVLNCASLAPNESIVFYKTFFSGFEYRINLCSETEGVFLFEIYDLKHNLIFSNLQDLKIKTWDFKPENSLQVVLFVTSRNNTKGSQIPLALVVGFKEIIL